MTRSTAATASVSPASRSAVSRLHSDTHGQAHRRLKGSHGDGEGHEERERQEGRSRKRRDKRGRKDRKRTGRPLSSRCSLCLPTEPLSLGSRSLTHFSLATAASMQRNPFDKLLRQRSSRRKREGMKKCVFRCDPRQRERKRACNKKKARQGSANAHACHAAF